MKKILALVLAVVMVMAMIACGGSTAPANTASDTKTETKTETKTDAAAAPAAEAKSYQLTGVYEEEGANAGMLNAWFLLNLNADGTAVADRYQYAQFNDAPAAENPTYQASYMSGTWKEVEKDGVACLQIKLAHIDDAGNSSNDQTAYAYDIAGEYSFDLTFPVVPGMSYTRIAPMSGTEEKVFADADAFIQAKKLDFVAPEHVVAFEGDNATLYVQADGKALMYVGKDKVADGKWTNDGALAIEIGGNPVEVAVDGNAASFTYSMDRGDGNMVDFNLACADISALGSVEAPEPAAPAEDAPYAAKVDLGGQSFDATLVLNEDGTAAFTAAVTMNVKYTKVGKAVVLEQDGELEGYAAQIFPAVPHAWLLNDETKEMTALKGAYLVNGALAFYLTDDTAMTAEYVEYNFGKDGFTYVLSEDGKTLTVTAPDAEALGAFAQVWDAMGGETWNLDGTTATKAE